VTCNTPTHTEVTYVSSLRLDINEFDNNSIICEISSITCEIINLTSIKFY